MKYCHENRLPFTPETPTELPRNISSQEISDLENWVVENDLIGIETGVPLLLRAGKRMNMMSIDMLDSSLPVDSPLQSISVDCWAWNRLKNKRNPAEMSILLQVINQADFSKSREYFRYYKQQDPCSTTFTISENIKKAMLKKWDAQSQENRTRYKQVKQPTWNGPDVRKQTDDEVVDYLRRLQCRESVTGLYLGDVKGLSWVQDRVVDDGDYCEKETIFLLEPLNDMISGGIFATRESLVAEMAVRGWAADTDIREFKIAVIQEFLNRMRVYRRSAVFYGNVQ